MAPKLKSLDEDYRKMHYEIVELLDESDATALAKEQETLDTHDDEVELLTVRIRQYVIANDTDSDSRTTYTRKLARLVRTVTTIQTAIDATPAPTDICLLHLHEEQLHDVRSEVGRIYNDLVAMKLSESDTLFTTQANLEKGVFDCSLKINAHQPSQPLLLLRLISRESSYQNWMSPHLTGKSSTGALFGNNLKCL